MTMRKTDQTNEQNLDSIQIEDLFEFKRMEKPQADFWEDFDAQLQQKILKSAMDRRNPFQKGWDLLSAKLLPVSALGTAAAAIAFAFAPNFQPQATETLKQPAPVVANTSSFEAPVMVMAAATVDFSQFAISATDELQTIGTQQFFVSDISAEIASSEVYETNELVVSADPVNLPFEEQLF
jgi:hypothetical protein